MINTFPSLHKMTTRLYMNLKKEILYFPPQQNLTALRHYFERKLQLGLTGLDLIVLIRKQI